VAEAEERRRAVRRPAETTGEVVVGREAYACHVIDVSSVGARIRIDGRRASRSLVGKPISLTVNGTPEPPPAPWAGRVVWARPAVAGVYLGLAFGERALA